MVFGPVERMDKRLRNRRDHAERFFRDPGAGTRTWLKKFGQFFQHRSHFGVGFIAAGVIAFAVVHPVGISALTIWGGYFALSAAVGVIEPLFPRNQPPIIEHDGRVPRPRAMLLSDEEAHERALALTQPELDRQAYEDFMADNRGNVTTPPAGARRHMDLLAAQEVASSTQPTGTHLPPIIGRQRGPSPDQDFDETHVGGKRSHALVPDDSALVYTQDHPDVVSYEAPDGDQAPPVLMDDAMGRATYDDYPFLR